MKTLAQSQKKNAQPASSRTSLSSIPRPATAFTRPIIPSTPLPSVSRLQFSLQDISVTREEAEAKARRRSSEAQAGQQHRDDEPHIRILPIQSPVWQPRSHIQMARGGGRPLPPAIQGQLEERMGADLDAVRIHADSKADNLTRLFNARALTTGPDIFFSRGEYNPSSMQGMRILAEEVEHSIQQSVGPVASLSRIWGIPVSDPSDHFERQAATIAARVAGGQSVTTPLRGIRPRVKRLPSVPLVLQRMIGDRGVVNQRVTDQFGNLYIISVRGEGSDGVYYTLKSANQNSTSFVVKSNDDNYNLVTETPDVTMVTETPDITMTEESFMGKEIAPEMIASRFGPYSMDREDEFWNSPTPLQGSLAQRLNELPAEIKEGFNTRLDPSIWLHVSQALENQRKERESVQIPQVEGITILPQTETPNPTKEEELLGEESLPDPSPKKRRSKESSVKAPQKKTPIRRSTRNTKAPHTNAPPKNKKKRGAESEEEGAPDTSQKKRRVTKEPDLPQLSSKEKGENFVLYHPPMKIDGTTVNIVPVEESVKVPAVTQPSLGAPTSNKEMAEVPGIAEVPGKNMPGIPDTARASKRPGYVLNIPCHTSKDLNKVLNKYGEEATRGMINGKERLGAVVGVNTRLSFAHKDGKDGEVEKLMKSKIADPGFPYSIIGFYWSPMFNIRGDVRKTFKDVKKDYDKELSGDKEAQDYVNKRIYKVGATEQMSLPYGIFRGIPLVSAENRDLIKQLASRCNPVYVHIGDPDAHSWTVNNDHKVGVLSRYDEILEKIGKRKEKEEKISAKEKGTKGVYPPIIIGGYNFGVPTAQDDPTTRLVKLGNIIERSIRRSIAAHVPETLYPTEPNMLLKAHEEGQQKQISEQFGEKPEELFGKKDSEGQALRTNLAHKLKRSISDPHFSPYVDATVETDIPDRITKSASKHWAGKGEIPNLGNLINQKQSYLDTANWTGISRTDTEEADAKQKITNEIRALVEEKIAEALKQKEISEEIARSIAEEIINNVIKDIFEPAQKDVVIDLQEALQ